MTQQNDRKPEFYMTKWEYDRNRRSPVADYLHDQQVMEDMYNPFYSCYAAKPLDD